jgi:CPA2 family monovalent cation:H+ antiporter-2
VRNRDRDSRDLPVDDSLATCINWGVEAQHLPVLIRDLAIILMAAGLVSVVFRWLRLPVVLGYVVAGVIVGPYATWFPTVTETESIRIWGEIGVIFVLFGIGLEFSFRKLAALGVPAMLTALLEAGVLFGLGTVTGRALGFHSMDAVFLGGMLCISSTTIIVKIFEERGLKARTFARFVLGVLIVEDLVAVLLLVLLSTLAATRQFSGAEMGIATLRLGFFLTLWFVIGLFLLPRVARSLRHHLSDETTMIFSIGLCLFMVLVASKAGFSAALGAFVMGSLLAETNEGPRIEHILTPLRNLFAAIFFVSVGMLFDPSGIVDQWPRILLISAVVIGGKILAVSAGAVLAGQTPWNGIRAGTSMTQIGEFSFIIAGLGMNLNVISKELYPLAVGVSLVTSFLTPVWISRSDSIYGMTKGLMPKWLKEAIERYHILLQRFRENSIGVVGAYAPLLIINSVLIIALSWSMRIAVYPYLQELLGKSLRVRLLGLIAVLLLCLPFFWGLCLRRPNRAWRTHVSAHPRARMVDYLARLVRVSLGVVFFFMIVAQYVGSRIFSGLSLLLFAGLAALFYRYGGVWYRVLEGRFMDHFNASEGSSSDHSLLPWDTQVIELVVAPESVLCGKSLEEMRMQEGYGVMLAAISRGNRRIVAPKASEVIFPYDRLYVVGADGDVDRLRSEVEASQDSFVDETPLSLHSVVLDENSSLRGRTIRESGIRDRVGGLVVGLERQGFRQLNPPADLQLEVGDRLWIVGEPEKIHRLNE